MPKYYVQSGKMRDVLSCSSPQYAAMKALYKYIKEVNPNGDGLSSKMLVNEIGFVDNKEEYASHNPETDNFFDIDKLFESDDGCFGIC